MSHALSEESNRTNPYRKRPDKDCRVPPAEHLIDTDGRKQKNRSHGHEWQFLVGFAIAEAVGYAASLSHSPAIAALLFSSGLLNDNTPSSMGPWRTIFLSSA